MLKETSLRKLWEWQLNIKRSKNHDYDAINAIKYSPTQAVFFNKPIKAKTKTLNKLFS